MKIIKELLEESIEVYGLSDSLTIMLNEKLHEEIILKQKEAYERWKREN